MNKKICYVLPSKYPSGGNKIAVEHLERLYKRGFETYISCVSSHKDEIKGWLPLNNVKEVPFTKKALEKMDCVTATYWETVLYINKLNLVNPKHYYFVQSTEWEFGMDNTEQMRVWATILDPKYSIITEARWIQRIINNRFKRQAFFVPNKLELPDTKDFVKYSRAKPVILVEGNAQAHFKGIREATMAVKDLKEDFEIWLLTNSSIDKLNPAMMGIYDRKFSGVSWGEALEIIWNADFFLKPSTLEGQSGPIMEALALGTPTVACAIPSAYETVIDGWNALLVSPNNINQMKDRLKRLSVDKVLREKLIKHGLESAKKWNNWENSIDKLVNIYE